MLISGSLTTGCSICQSPFDHLNNESLKCPKPINLFSPESLQSSQIQESLNFFPLAESEGELDDKERVEYSDFAYAKIISSSVFQWVSEFETSRVGFCR